MVTSFQEATTEVCTPLLWTSTLGQAVADKRGINAQGFKQLGSGVGTLAAQKGEQKMVCLDAASLGGAGLFDGAFENRPRSRGERGRSTGEDGPSRRTRLADFDADRRQGSPVEGVCSNARGLEVNAEGPGGRRVLIV